MIYKFFLSIVVVCCVEVVHISGQPLPCVPLSVENVTISHEAVLSWQANADEVCTISYYFVYVDTPSSTEFAYAVANTRLSVNFLPVCDEYIFTIAPVTAENVEGSAIRYPTKIPLPANANLTVAFLKVTQQESSETVLLEWNLEEAWAKCPDRYRVVVDDQDLDYLQDIYTYGNSLQIPSLAPCTSYEFGIIAIYNWEIEGPITVVRYDAPPAEITAPKLSNIALGNTYVNLTWQLQSYPLNKCTVTDVSVEVSDISESFHLTVPVLDQTNRQPITITIPNLTPDNLYFVNTSIINIAGYSDPVILAVQTRT